MCLEITAKHRATCVCQKIIDLAPECKTKGKYELTRRIAHDLTSEGTTIAQSSVRYYIQTIRAVTGKGTPYSGHKHLFPALCKEPDFVTLAKQAIRVYDMLGHDLVSIAYEICHRIIALAPKYKSRGKSKIQRRIAQDLTSEGTTIAQSSVWRYVQTIRAVAGKGTPHPDHKSRFPILCKDPDFVTLAKQATKVYDALGYDSVSIAHEICQKIIAFAPECKTKGKYELTRRIAQDLTSEGTTIAQISVWRYVQTVRAVAGKGTPSPGHEHLFPALCKEPDFVTLAKQATDAYDAIPAYERGSKLDAALTSIAVSNFVKVIQLMPAGLGEVHAALRPVLRRLSDKTKASTYELAEEVVVRVFAGYLYDRYKQKKLRDPVKELAARRVPEELHERILEVFELAKTHVQKV